MKMPPKDYKDTLQLPKTSFPMKANLPQREPGILERWKQTRVYQRLLEARASAPLFVLHDGPPYANGPVHMGTALNKVLKDFIVRSRAMAGYRTPYVPGWDCNGMPIEHQVLRALGDRARETPKTELRARCRAHAEKFIKVQSSEFQRLGVIGDWENPYLTFAPSYAAAEIAQLRRLVEEGYVYRGLRPVHWCYECRTALAEAEVEYREHESPSIYVAFRVNEQVGDAGALALREEDRERLRSAQRAGRLFALIWTTTPWTLPANLGICLNQRFDYVALEAGQRWFIVADKLADSVANACGLAVTARVPLSGEALRALDGRPIFRHPFASRDVILMFGEHVTLDAGTGLVHTAPGHGYEDFVVGSAYGLETLTPVDEAGVFTEEAGRYAGLRVFDANDSIVADLRAGGALLNHADYHHTYPHCWRCRQPVIFRATEQWFLRIDHRDLRSRLLAAIDSVKWIPRWSRERIANMVATRPDWCLSRQRAWGVPIPAIRCTGCGEVSLESDVMERAERLFGEEGADSWYRRPVTDFCGEGRRCNTCGGSDFAKGEDILDVWFDSGCSQAAVLARRAELSWPADLYLEAVDQHRGWFQVSLIPAVALRGAAPYRAVLTHGLTLDEQGRKMSKSLGNAEDAIALINRLGADVLRLVFASVDCTADMNIGPAVFAAATEAYRKFRNTCRFLLGNLFDFEPESDCLPYSELFEFDRFILARTAEVIERACRKFAEYDFQAVYHTLLNFVVVDVSALYIDVVRDRLYCSAATSRERRSAQTAVYLILDALTRLLAPLIPYTADEVYAYMPGRTADSVHLLEFPRVKPEWQNDELRERWARLLQIRAEAMKVIELMRQREMVGASLEAGLKLVITEDSKAGEELFNMLAPLREGLEELMIVSRLEVVPFAREARLSDLATDDGGVGGPSDGRVARRVEALPLAIMGWRLGGSKCQRCWRYFTAEEQGENEVCPRCRKVLDTLQ